jgi:hypothetical protein
MAPRPAAPLYLARESYKRRRLIDAQRLLPIILFLLYLLPLVWGGEDSGSPIGLGVRSYVHVFVIWGCAIGSVAFITRALMRADASLDATGEAWSNAADGDQHDLKAGVPHLQTDLGTSQAAPVRER